MTEQPQQPLNDDDIETVSTGSASEVPGDADGTDGDAIDTVDGDSSDSDGTDGSDGDGTDGTDDDGTDGDSDGTDS
jgi:hypothetical protein